MSGTGTQALVAQVRGQLRERGERMTSQRRAVLIVLSRHTGHATADEVFEAVAATNKPIARTSIYRTLEALSGLGVVQHIHLGHGATAYHLADHEAAAHLHAQCRDCARIYDLPAGLLDEVAARLADELDFRLDPAHAALSGLCADCRETPFPRPTPEGAP